MHYYVIYDRNGELINKRALEEVLVSDRAVEVTKEEFDALNIDVEGLLLELHAKLTKTDYIACKIAEGSATREEYSDMIAKRAAWRDKINELMGE